MSKMDYAAVRVVLWNMIWLNLVATLPKLIIGLLNNSLSLVADGIDSAFDAASNVIGLVGIAVARKPADEEYPYGRQKAETVTALVISIFLFLTTWELGKSAVDKLLNPSGILLVVNAWSFIALGISILVHLILVKYELGAGRRLHSDILISDAMNVKGDIYLSLGVAVGLIIASLGFPLADPIFALIVAIFIAKIGIDLIRRSTPTLMDKAKTPAKKIEQIALSIPGIVSIHNIRSRGHDQAVFADLHIRVDPVMTTMQAHSIAHELQTRLRGVIPDIQDVTIHVEPSQDKMPTAPNQREFARKLRYLASKLGLTVHDVWAHSVMGDYYIEAHLEVDGSITLQEAHGLASTLEDQAKADIPHLVELTTHIEPRGRLIGEKTPLTNEAEMAQVVQDIVDGMPGGVKVHEVHVRQGAHAGWVVTLHCNLPGDMLLSEAHDVSEKLESYLRKNLSGLELVIIHTEPINTISDVPESSE